MKHVSFEEYEAAKAEIIGGVHYIEKSTMENDVIHKTYSTEENGTFYEVNDKDRVEFWSGKHSESRIYDENERATETDKKAGLRRFAFGENQSEHRCVEADRL